MERLLRDQLIRKALLALHDLTVEAGKAPVRPTPLLRFALAFLYVHSDGDRQPYDDFWRTVRDPDPHAYSQDSADYARSTYARTYLAQIARGVGARAP